MAVLQNSPGSPAEHAPGASHFSPISVNVPDWFELPSTMTYAVWFAATSKTSCSRSVKPS